MATKDPEKSPAATNKEKKAHKIAKTQRQKIARDRIAAFIVGLAAIIGQAYWFTIRGDCEMGLSLTTMLTVEEYAALLFVGGLVNVKNKRGGGHTVEISVDNTWNGFLRHYELLGMDNITEATVSQVKVDAFKRRKKGTKIGETQKDLHLLRIGQYEPGETIVASTQLSTGIDPPNFSKSRKTRPLQFRVACHPVYPQSNKAKYGLSHCN
jgi:hypothetical protein